MVYPWLQRPELNATKGVKGYTRKLLSSSPCMGLSGLTSPIARCLLLPLPAEVMA